MTVHLTVKNPQKDSTAQVATARFDSPVGPLLARCCGGFLTELSFDRSSELAPSTAKPGGRADSGILRSVRAQLKEYFAGERTMFDIPLQLHGSTFQLRVWDALQKIPYGQTISYKQLAERLGLPEAVRAVGAANGANPVAIIVPCHRVIGADGTLVGYGGGLERKRILLDLESNRLRLSFPES